MVEIKKGIYLARNDPRFLEKYLHYHRNDRRALYQYAQQLECEGRLRKAYQYYQAAAKHGHPLAKEKLNTIALWQQLEPRNRYTHQLRNRRYKRLVLLILLIFLLVMLGMLFHHWLNVTNLFRNETNIYETHVIRHTITEEPPAGLTTAEDLPLLVVRNAIRRYREVNGVFPENLAQLTRPAPENWLSTIPGAFTYTPVNGGFTLAQSGKAGAEPLADLLELRFYEETNQLALARGNETLAVYPVASGKTGLPFHESRITGRVVDPNGGKGALGTRGLALGEHYAIHGTNDPASVGQRISGGCLRMLNADIETLYPYVAKGTPFKVVNGAPPASVTFPAGLPALGNPSYADWEKEKTGAALHWLG
jgi:hypothetical protein